MEVKINGIDYKEYRYFMNKIRNKMYWINLNIDCYIKMMIGVSAINADNDYLYYSMDKYLEIMNKFGLSIICNDNNGY